MNFYLNGIFGWWLSHLLSMVTLFAAGGVALGGGDGGSVDIAGGGEAGGEGEGSGAGEFGGEGGEEDLGGDGGEEDLGGDGQRQSAQQRAAAAQDARLPANIKKLLNDLKTTDPKAAGLVRQAIFAQQAWQKVIPGGIRHAREMVTTFNELGGLDGIRAIQDESRGYQEELQGIDEGWNNKPEEFIANMAEEDPEAFSRNIPIALEQLRKVDKDGYNFTLARIFHNTMNSSGVLGTLSSLWQLAKANATAPGMAGVIEGLSTIAEWANGISQLAQNQPERRPDKGLERLKTKEKEFETKQFEAFKKDVGRDVRLHMETSIERELGKFLLQRKINISQLRQKDPDSFQAMVAEVDRRIAAAITADKGWLAQKDRLMKSGDKAKVLRMYQQKVDSLLQDNNGQAGIARKVAKIFYRGAPGAGNKPNQNAGNNQDRTRREQNTNQGAGGQGGGQGKTVRLNAQPAGNLIDWGRTSDSMILDGECYLKGKSELHKWRG